MVKPAWTNIVRHVPIAAGASSDDPDLTGYWAKRRRKIKPVTLFQLATCYWSAYTALTKREIP
jgi:hypothetical protein